MQGINFTSHLQNLINGRDLSSQLKLTEFNHPKAAFFGNVPEERKEIRYEFDNITYDFIDSVLDVFDYLEDGISVRVTNGWSLDTLQIRILDHAFGVMVQHYARAFPDKDHFMVPYGLLTLEGAAHAFEETVFLMRDFITPSTDQLARMMGHIHSQKLHSIRQTIEKDTRLIVPAANLDLSCTASGLSDETLDSRKVPFEEVVQRPFVNFDLQMGGQVGWVRLNAVLSKFIDSHRRPSFSMAGQYLATRLDQLEYVIEHSLGNMLEEEAIERVIDHIQVTKEFYLG